MLMAKYKKHEYEVDTRRVYPDYFILSTIQKVWQELNTEDNFVT